MEVKRIRIKTNLDAVPNIEDAWYDVFVTKELKEQLGIVVAELNQIK